ncbi:gibberellin 2-beta-dioxygenase 2 [Daucus carota subsp. sativus]|uniref:gibberellin 2-beta-dioxygenase 2 n=1 Tax=Daucus carota subsp. sativus TaxID=79200 RepID=UPI0007EF4FA5|nr:PREDICTED: gibberellin 2-beta-dioxygenase 2-like isoform X2 [Daucus carota subsp. sativus]
MVAASPAHHSSGEDQSFISVPRIDMSLDRHLVANRIVKACEDYGFFRLVNHGVPDHIISSMEEEVYDFFSKPACKKQEAGPPSPFGYGCKLIGLNGDMGELEYILLETNPMAISRRSLVMSTDPIKFSDAVTGYLQAMKDLCCKILDHMAQGLQLPDKSLSCLIKDNDNDSCFRVNHYPPFDGNANGNTNNSLNCPLVGFGEHCDPQIITIQRSNNVGGLQIYSKGNHCISVPPHPTEFCVFVGDALQCQTSSAGKFEQAVQDFNDVLWSTITGSISVFTLSA